MRGGSSTPPNTPAVDGDDDPSSHDSLSPLRSPLRSAVAPREDEDEALPDDIPETSKSSVFTALLFAQVLVYAEAGAIPALLDRLSAAFSLTYYQQGLLGGVVYVGISLGAPFASFAYHKYEPKSVLMVSLLLNLISVIFFGLTPESWPLALTGARFLIGVTQSFLAIFCPVWVDVYASRSKQTQWFSGLQASVPIGIHKNGTADVPEEISAYTGKKVQVTQFESQQGRILQICAVAAGIHVNHAARHSEARGSRDVAEGLDRHIA